MSDGLHLLPDGPAAAIESIIDKSSIRNVKVNVEGAVPKGQNYTGMIYRVTVTGEEDSRDVTKNYIVKVASNNGSIRADIPLTIVYQREAMYYTELFPIYQQMQDEAGISIEEQFRFANCYDAGKDYLNEFLVFEDLKPDGYVILDRKYEMDYEHARCALEAYGKLHALSFALKKGEPEKFKDFVQNNTEMMIVKSGVFMNLLKHACEKAIPVVKNVKYREILEGLKENFLDRLLDTLTQDEFSVLSHGDCWAGNMMFKYKNGKPVKTCLLDFQICRYGAPTLDLVYYIFTSTGQKLREERYEDLLLVYHNALKNHLKALSYDIEQIYPWTRFQQDLKKSSIFGLATGITVALITLSDEELTPDISEFTDFSNTSLFKSKVSDIYKERLNGIVEDFFKYGYLSLSRI